MIRKEFYNYLIFLKKTNETRLDKTVFPQEIFPKILLQTTNTNSEIKSKVSNLNTLPLKSRKKNFHLLFNTYPKFPLKKIPILQKIMRVINWLYHQPQIKLFLKILIPFQTIWKDIHQVKKFNSFHNIRIPTHPHRILVITMKITKSMKKCGVLKK